MQVVVAAVLIVDMPPGMVIVHGAVVTVVAVLTKVLKEQVVWEVAVVVVVETLLATVQTAVAVL
jgi:hypothetical protein